MHRRFHWGGEVVVWLVSACLASHAVAAETEVEDPQAPAGEVITVVAPAAIDLLTGSASVIDAEAERGRGEQLTDVLARTPGVSARRTGALGSFTNLSIRGLGGRNVAVILDDQPLASVTLGPIDVALLPLESVSSIEIYRGNAPARYSGPLGGVVRLRTEEPGETLRASGVLGYGSFLTRTASATVTGPVGSLGFVASAAYQGTRGDFTYYDDRETLYTTADDSRRKRSNNASNAGLARVRLTYPGPHNGSLRLTTNALFRDQGVAGSGARQTSATHATDAELVSRLSLDNVMLGRLYLTSGADVLYAGRTFKDPQDEVGLSIADSKSSLLQGAVDARATFLWSASQVSELAPRLAIERYRQSGQASSASFTARELDRTRLLLGAGVEHRLSVVALTLVPSLRVDAEHNRGTAVSGIGEAFEASPRLGALYEIGACGLRANAGRYHRLPTSSERFGDGVTTVPNPNLRAEQGLSTDGGIRCHGRVASLRLSGEITGFATRAQRLITLVQNSQLSGVATNLGETHVAGLESFARATASWFDVSLAYTLTDSRDASGTAIDGNRTPGIALHDAHGRVQIGPTALHAWYDLDVRSSVFLDNGNLRPVPTRALHGAGIEAHVPGTAFSFTLSARNLGNLIVEDVHIVGAPSAVPSKVSDYLGNPLPGRSVFFSLLWRSS